MHPPEIFTKRKIVGNFCDPLTVWASLPAIRKRLLARPRAGDGDHAA